jgi:hypothetical protein
MSADECGGVHTIGRYVQVKLNRAPVGSRLSCPLSRKEVSLAAKKPSTYVGDVARDLRHPWIIRMRCESTDWTDRNDADVDEE